MGKKKTHGQSNDAHVKTYEIYNAAKRSRRPVAQLRYDTRADKASIHIAEDAQANELPFMLALFVEQGKHEVPDKWARRWVQERIPPQGRQNLGEILRANGLQAYDEIALLEASQGRSSQDDFLIRAPLAPSVEYAIMDIPRTQSKQAGQAAQQEPTGQMTHHEPAQARSWCEMIGPKLADRRKALGLTQQELAENTGIDQAAISRIESGRANPTLGTLDSLAEGVGARLMVKLI